MSHIRCIIVDDEPHAVEGLKLLIEKVGDLTLLVDFDNAVNANSYLSFSKEVDLIFTDIQMPQITGIEWIQSLQKPPLVIFTSAHADFAIKGFELNAIDYLLKPKRLVLILTYLFFRNLHFYQRISSQNWQYII